MILCDSHQIKLGFDFRWFNITVAVLAVESYIYRRALSTPFGPCHTSWWVLQVHTTFSLGPRPSHLQVVQCANCKRSKTGNKTNPWVCGVITSLATPLENLVQFCFKLDVGRNLWGTVAPQKFILVYSWHSSAKMASSMVWCVWSLSKRTDSFFSHSVVVPGYHTG